jgi:hypothetical protein
MKSAARLGTIAIVLAASACNFVGGVPATAPAAGGGAYRTSPEVADTLRRQEKQSFAVSDAAADAEQDKLEKKVQHALKLALGREGAAPGQPPPEASSATLTALRTGGIQLRVEPVTNMEGGAVADNFVMLKDSFTDRVIALQRKMVEHTASPAETKEIQDGAKYMMKLNDLKLQVSTMSMAAMQTNTRVQIGGMTDLRVIASMVQSRKQHAMEGTDDDWSEVQAILGRQRRTQALAASTIGMLAAYEAVIGQKGDPKALDAIAKATLDSFPLDATVSSDDAKAYVAGLADNAAAQKAKYEGWMRGTFGDDKYERQYKANIDRIFDQAGAAGQTKSIAQVQSDSMARYNADLAKCARGEPLGPGSLVGPAKCKDAQAQGGAGGPGQGGGSVPTGGLPAGAQARMDQVQSGVVAAKAIANGDVGGALDAAQKMFPGDGPIQSSLQGIAALTKGDVKGALTSALALAPGGGLVKQGLSLAAQLLKLF